MIFSKESLKRSVKPIIVLTLLCLLVWIWGNHRSVNVDLTLLPQISSSEKLSHLDLTIYKNDSETDVERTLNLNISDGYSARQSIDIKPGSYFLRGIVTTTSGKTHIVTQTIVVPEDSASIDLYLREK